MLCKSCHGHGVPLQQWNTKTIILRGILVTALSSGERRDPGPDLFRVRLNQDPPEVLDGASHHCALSAGLGVTEGTLHRGSQLWYLQGQP